MDIINEYVEATLNQKSAEESLINELIRVLEIPPNHIKSIRLENDASQTQVNQYIMIELSGKNRFKASNVSKIDGLTIITPNSLEINVGEFVL